MKRNKRAEGTTRPACENLQIRELKVVDFNSYSNKQVITETKVMFHKVELSVYCEESEQGH